jgi:hypothetical protein
MKTYIDLIMPVLIHGLIHNNDLPKATFISLCQQLENKCLKHYGSNLIYQLYLHQQQDKTDVLIRKGHSFFSDIVYANLGINMLDYHYIIKDDDNMLKEPLDAEKRFNNSSIDVNQMIEKARC